MIPPAHPYLGRLAPSPTGYLHLGHARTFWIAAHRARQAGGELLLRNDDLDHSRCRPHFIAAMFEDLRWLGFTWREPVITQSARLPLYRHALAQLHAAKLIYPCYRSRRDLADTLSAPHEGGESDEPLYPQAWRPDPAASLPLLDAAGFQLNWRFRIPDDEPLAFNDHFQGPQTALCGRDFGDFLVWRKDGLPSYQLASVVDDAELRVTEVVRGADLIKSTFRQLLLFRALGYAAPSFFHCPLVTDANGVRLAKRHDAAALRTLRDQGESPETICARWHEFKV